MKCSDIKMFLLITFSCVLTARCAQMDKTVPSIELVNNTLHKGLTEKIGNFSTELLFFATQNQGRENLIISPITVWTVLAVITEGAADDTLKQISQAIRVLPKYKDRVKKEYQDLAKWLQVNTTTVELQKFNALFVDEVKGPLLDFLEAAKEYDTRMISVNFSDPVNTANRINTVINRVTHDRIPQLISSDDLENTNLVLASALYFKGQWTHPFNKTWTRKQSFFDSNGSKIGEVNMMYNKFTYPFANIDNLQAKVLELPYGAENRLSMLIMLPNHGVTLNEMFYNLGKLSLDAVFNELKVSREQYTEDEVDCFLPRFKIESSLTLNNALSNIGVIDLFDARKARLPLMARYPVYVSKIIHKAEIEVTEEGTTASAATAAEFGNRIGAIRFEVNRPFCYLIIEKVTNTIAFGGVYQTPSLY